jgi:hypothetical protein
MVQLRVECYAGFRGEETPRRILLGTRVVEVVDVIDRWLAPDHRYFKIAGADGARYILRHDTGTARWELVMFERRSERSPIAPEKGVHSLRGRVTAH